MSEQRSNIVTGVGAMQGGSESTVGCLPPGYVLREFTIERVLGEGGFGVVYSAIDQKLERRVAIKEYMPTALAARAPDYSVHVRSSAQHRDAFEAGRRSFINEAKLLARFEHPALIKVYQFWEDKGTAYMVMPFYNAPTLKTWVKQRGAPPDEAWLTWFLDRLIDALAALHREQCLHRDVAPDNILLLGDTSPLLLDFGAARRVIGDLTQALTVILKPGFAPIEQYAETAAMKQGPWTDVYALSAVAYYVITGSAPPPAVARVVNDDVVPLQTLAAEHYSPRLLSTLDAGLAVRPEARPHNMAVFRALLLDPASAYDAERTVMAPMRTTAPEALHSTYSPPPEDATRINAASPAHPSTTGAPGSHTSAPTVPLTTPSRSTMPTQRLTRQPVPVTTAPTAPPLGVRQPTIKPPLVTGTRAPTQAPVAAPRRGQLEKTVFIGALVVAAVMAIALVYLLLGRGGSTRVATVEPAGKPAITAPPLAPPTTASDALTSPPAEPVVASAGTTKEPRAPAGAMGQPPIEQASVERPAAPARPAADAPAASGSTLPAQPAAERPPIKTVVAAPAQPASSPARPSQPASGSSAPAAPSPVATRPAAAPPHQPSPSTASALGLQPTPAPQVAAATPPPAPTLAPKKVETAPVPVAPAQPEPPLKSTPTNLGVLASQAELPANADPRAPIFEGYACCNLRYAGDWISDLANLQGPYLPVGAPVKVKSYGRYRVGVTIDGKPMRLGLDYGRREESLPQLARKIVIGQDPRPRIATFSHAVQRAIAQGKVLIGMTKEQALMSLGYPPPHETKSLDAPQWKYWYTSRAQFSLVWDARGLLKDVTADQATRDAIVGAP